MNKQKDEDFLISPCDGIVTIIIPQNSFQWCDRLCLKCQVSDPSQCISCKLPNMIVNSNFQCVCQDGFYLDSNQVCQQCSPTCKTCSDHNTCLTCDDTQFRIYNSNTNLCDCKQSYYSLSSQPVCLKCPYYCKTCQFNNQQNQIKCLQCFQNPELNRSITGNCQCLLGYFDGGTNLQCSFNNTNFRLLNPSKLSCNPGTYEDVVNKICKNCPTKCKECQKQGLKLFCTACDTNGTFRLNDQTCSCQSGYYDAGQKQCKQCNSGCTTCDQQGQCQNSCSQNCISCNSPTVCTKCQPLTYLVNQQCQTQCNSNQHADNVQQICIDCPSFCNKCDLDPTKCQICASNYVLFNETCLTSCPDTYYKDSNSICQPCLQNCSQCDSSQICNVCKVGYSLYQSNQCLANCPDKFYSDSNNICQPCQQNCIQCNFSGVCSKCTDNFYLFQNQQCLQNCPQNYFHEDSSKTCQKCMNNCDTCSSSDTCSQCQQNYYLLNNSQCLSDCPQKFYKDSQKSICAECSSNCDQCSDSISCQICSSRFFLLNNLSCVQKCPDGYFENKSQRICNQCSTNFCQKCKQQNSCIVCENSYFLKENQCVTQCGQGYQIQNNSCIACKANNCLGCDKQVDQCSSCKDGFDLFKNECVMKCKQNQIRDQNGSCSTQNQFKLENKKNNQILMTFQSKPNLEEVKKNLQVNILNLQSQFDYSVDIQDDLTLIITINCSKKLDTKQTVTISINDNNNQFATPYQQIDVQIIQKKQDENPAATKSFETATQAVSSATMAAIFPLALSGNFWMISSILDISQIIYMTSFIQFEQFTLSYNLKKHFNLKRLTSTLDTFLSSQKDFKIPFPNFFEYINDYEEIYYDTPPQIKEKDIQGFYLSNMGDTISLFAIILLAYIFLKLLVFLFKKCQKANSVLIKLENKLFPITLIADLLWVVYQDMCFSVILQFLTLSFVIYNVEILNYLAFSISSLAIFMPLYLAYIIYSGVNKRIQEHLTKNQQFKYYQILLYFRKFFYTVVIGSLQKSPIAQILLIIIFHLIFLLIVIKLKPFKENFFNIKEGIQCFSFMIIHIFVLALYFVDESDSINTQDICWVILSLFSTIIVIEILICIKEIYLEIKEIYIKYKTNKMKKLTIVPFDENKVNEKSEKQILEDQKLFSKQIKENEISMQDQNIGLDLSPRKLDNRQNISNLLDQYQTQITYDLSTPVKRVLRNKRSIKLMEAKTQVPENNNISNLLKFQQSQSEISIEGQTFRDFRVLSSQRSNLILRKEYKNETNHKPIIESLQEIEINDK